MGFPAWAIGIVIILIIISISTAIYFIFRGKKRAAVGAQDEEAIVEKTPSSSAYPAIKPLYNETSSTLKSSNQSTASHNHSSSTIPTSSYTSNKSINERRSLKSPSSPMREDNASVITEDSNLQKPLFMDTIKFNLPLPPPSTSLFADKMELDSFEANDLFQSYMIASQNQEFESVDLNDNKPFLSTAAANIQQKAANLRTTLYQSLRRKSTNKVGGAPINQFFDNLSHHNSSSSSLKSPTKSPVESARMSRQSSSTSARFPRSPMQTSTPSLPHTFLPPSPAPESPIISNSLEGLNGKFSNNSSKKSLVRQEQEEEQTSNKIMIDTIPNESYFSLPMTPITPSPIGLKSKTTIPSSGLNVTGFTNVVDEINQINNDKEIESEEEEIQENKHEEESEEEEDQKDMNSSQQVASAARKLIRSASRKSRTRSMIVADETAQAMFTSFIKGENIPSTPSTNNATKYASVRINNKKSQPVLQKIDTSEESIRGQKQVNKTNHMDIKNWSSSNEDKVSYSPSTPSPQRALMSSTISGSATVSGRKAMRAQNQLQKAFQGGSSDDLLLGTEEFKADTISRKFTATSNKESLANLFSPPSDINEKSNASNNKQTEPLLVRTQSVVSTNSDTDILNITETPSSPITIESSSPYSSKNNTLRKVGNNVDTIRKMLQSSWSGNSIKESGSNNSLTSSNGGDKSNRSSAYMGSIGSSYRSVISPVGSVNPRLQNQHLVSLSLKASNSQTAGRTRPSMPIGFMNDDVAAELEGPTPTVSFSSSTVRTMIPAEEAEEELKRPRQKKSVMGNLLGSRQNNRTRQPSKLGSGLNKQGKTPAQKEREKYLKSLEA